ncbi:SCO6745 family protein [Phaeacidiphilus oryzae]|uniref:SCO6745 family protein n=1 Tax=Phaeacidiphilus oryzae TaxID=348818 RepID=UPI000566B954|nr:hypothetical protein [Phaeacidiphilus oryzae]
MTTTPLPPRAGRRCQSLLNTLHASVYFSSECAEEFAKLGVTERPAVNFAHRAGALGPVGPSTVAAVFNSYKPEFIEEYVPEVWRTVAPDEAVDARYRAVDRLLRRVLGEERALSAETAEAAGLALRAVEACAPYGRPLYAAHADLPVPLLDESPHLALWHAATLLREYRGDGHIAVLQDAELTGLDAQVSHTASGRGMSRKWVALTRGWNDEDWAAATERLRSRGLLDADGELTEEGAALRTRLEEETDRLDRAPYEHLGAEGVARLTELTGALVERLAAGGVFPGDLIGKR